MTQRSVRGAALAFVCHPPQRTPKHRPRDRVSLMKNTAVPGAAPRHSKVSGTTRNANGARVVAAGSWFYAGTMSSFWASQAIALPLR